MSKVAIVTDSNSGITQAQAKELGIRVMPMPFYINEEMLLEDIDLTQEQFYERLTEGADIHTSTPILTDFTELWDELLEEYDEIVHIPMSSGLSSTCSTAAMLAQDYEGKVFVVDNQRISVTQRQSVMDAMELAAAGKSGQEIYDKLMENKMESSIYIMLDTLYYLKKGGRITPAVAAIGSVLNIKPVMWIGGDKLDAHAKARGMKGAFRKMCKALHEDLDGRLKDLHDRGELVLGIAYTWMEEEELNVWKEELVKEFPGETIVPGTLMLSIGCHVGPGALGIGAVRKIKE